MDQCRTWSLHPFILVSFLRFLPSSIHWIAGQLEYEYSCTLNTLFEKIGQKDLYSFKANLNYSKKGGTAIRRPLIANKVVLYFFGSSYIVESFILLPLCYLAIKTSFRWPAYGPKRKQNRSFRVNSFGFIHLCERSADFKLIGQYAFRLVAFVLIVVFVGTLHFTSLLVVTMSSCCDCRRSQGCDHAVNRVLSSEIVVW